MRARLSNSSLGQLPDNVTAPRFDRAKIKTGIVHLGVGAFHRSHQAVYVDDCLSAGDAGWGIVGASLRSTDTRDALQPQDGLYTVAIRSGEGEQLRVVGAMLSLLVAPEYPSALLDALTGPDVRIVTLTVTEKAYLRAADGGLDARHPDIVHDLANPAAPKTVHGFLVEALARRRAAGTAPFTVLCCDNLPANGVTLKRVLLDFAKLRDAELASHVASDVAFPSSMVDRIVPATTDPDRARVSAELGLEDAWPVMTEPFSQWVVEDHFPAGRPDWEQFGVTMVKDVTPFEDMKLRLLNGSHSSIAYLGLLLGHATVDASFADARVRRFVDGLWREAIPTLPEGSGLDPQDYIGRLAERFANPALAHQTKQIANDGSQKLPQRIVASALSRLHAGGKADHLSLVLSAWIHACAQRGTALPAGHFTDPLDSALADFNANTLPAAEAVSGIFDLAGFAHGDSLRDTLKTLTTNHLTSLRDGGAAATLERMGG